MLMPAIINQIFDVQKFLKEIIGNTGNTLRCYEC
jgi:hypothetical protein